MSRQGFTSSDVAQIPPTSHTAVANTVTRTNLWVPALWTPIPAFDMQPGKAYQLRCGGVLSTTGTPTIVFNPTFGQSATPASNLALGASTTTALGSALSGVPWYAEMVVGVRSLGIAASGSTITGNGVVVIGGVAAAVSQSFAIGGTVVATADHTTAQGLCLDVTWGTQSASNTITCQWTLLASLN
jgi:hypothetical protein